MSSRTSGKAKSTKYSAAQYCRHIRWCVRLTLWVHSQLTLIQVVTIYRHITANCMRPVTGIRNGPHFNTILLIRWIEEEYLGI